MEVYDGIEKNPVDRMLLYISSQQQSDGGLTGPDRYLTTANAALILTEARLMDNDQYSAMVSFLKSAPTETVREQAMKARVLSSLNDKGYEDILTALLKLQHGDGGFGLTPYHQSDALTTLEVAWAMWATQYYKKDSQPLAKALLYAALSVDKDGAVRYSADGPASPYLVARMLQYFVVFESFKISAATGQGEQIDISMRDKINAMLSFLKAGSIRRPGVCPVRLKFPTLLTRCTHSNCIGSSGSYRKKWSSAFSRNSGRTGVLTTRCTRRSPRFLRSHGLTLKFQASPSFPAGHLR